MNILIGTDSMHGVADAGIEFGPNYDIDLSDIRFNYTVTQNRDISYRIYLHQHPYVQNLTQHLLRGGVNGLQDADTDYIKKSDGSFETLPADAVVHHDVAGFDSEEPAASAKGDLGTRATNGLVEFRVFLGCVNLPIGAVVDAGHLPTCSCLHFELVHHESLLCYGDNRILIRGTQQVRAVGQTRAVARSNPLV